MLVTLGQTSSESILDVVKDATRYSKELEALKKARKEASDAFIKLSQGKDAEKMLEEAKKIKTAALKEREEKIADAEAFLADVKTEAKTVSANLKKQIKEANDAQKRAASLMEEALLVKKEADKLFAAATSRVEKAEKEYQSALQTKEDWINRVQDIKQRLKGII